MITATPNFSLMVQRGPDWLFVTVHGITPKNSGAVSLADEVCALMRQYLANRVVLALDEVRMLDSHLIGELIVLQRRIAAWGGLMRISGLSPYNCRILERCRLNDRFVPYQTWEDAVKGCCPPRQPR